MLMLQAQTQAMTQLALSVEQLAEVIAQDYADEDEQSNVGLDGRPLS